jgi:hypothetical protein
MSKSIFTLAAAVAIVSLGSLLPAQAGGGATSASSRYSHTAHTQNLQNHQTQTAEVGITEFSSSSAKSSPKR